METWALAVGKVILNFGIIEACSRDWVDKIVRDEEFYENYAAKPLQNRIDILIKIVVQNNFSDKEAIVDTWERAKTLLIKRNIIVHNPVLSFGEYDDSTPPMLMPNLRPSNKDKTENPNILRIDEIFDIGEKSAELVNEIENHQINLNANKAVERNFEKLRFPKSHT